MNRVHINRRSNIRSITVEIGNFIHSNRRMLRADGIQFVRQMAGQEDDAVFELYERLVNEFDERLQYARNRLDPQAGERMILSVTGMTENGQFVTIHINESDWHNVTGDLIMNRLSQALNSYQTLADRFRVVIAVRPNSVNRANVGAKTQYRGDFSIFMKSKKSVVTIEEQDPSKDYCVFQWLALGMAFLVFKGQAVFDGFVPNTWKELTKGGSKQQKRREMSAHVARLLNMSLHRVQDMAFFQHAEQTLGIHIVILDFWKMMSCIYPSESRASSNLPKIVGITETSTGEFSHIDFVSKVHGLEQNGRSRFCFLCHTFYNRKQGCAAGSCKSCTLDICTHCHTCIGACIKCGSSDCTAGEEAFTDLIRCDECRKEFYDVSCLANHTCSSVHVAKCSDCGLPVHYGLRCGEFKCRQCGEVCRSNERSPHICYLQREKMRDPYEKYVVYDFECCIGEDGEHVPYLATAWLPFYSEATMAILTEKYYSHVYPLDNDPNNPVFVFFGLDGVEVFFDFIREKVFSKHIFYAHNGRAYDHILIKQALMKKFRLFSSDIKRGQKYIQMHYPDLKITFRDSLSFIPSSLRSMSSDFKIDELRKGHFPHKLMTVDFLKAIENYDFMWEIPLKDDFEHDFEKQSEREEFEKWYQLFSAQEKWNVKKDAIDYCVSDTVLLGKVLLAFRKECMDMTAAIDRPEDFDGVVTSLDPFAYVTLPSAIMSFYLSQMIPQKTIAIIDRYSSQMDQIEKEWLLYEEHRAEEYIQPRVLVGAHYVTGASSSSVYMFYACYKHGCAKCFSPTGMNTRYKKPFEELYRNTIVREQHIRSSSQRNVQVMWQCEWEKLKADSVDIKEFLASNELEIQRHIPLDPRDAYRGGKSEVYKLKTDQPISMVDFVSQYPTAMLGESYDPYEVNMKRQWNLPTGYPQMIHHPIMYDPFSHALLGIAKVEVLPPSNLYCPFLSYQTQSLLHAQAKEVIYGLCRECMRHRYYGECFHEEHERAFIGTWTLSEIRYAIQLGYRVLSWIEVWEYPTQSNTLFRNFIVPFMKNKICSKAHGLVEDGVFTAKGLLVQSYLHELTGSYVDPSDFQNNPARRTVSKLIQNAFTGKWGQKEDYSNSAVFYEHDIQKCMKLVNDPNIRITYLEVLDIEGQMISMNYEPYSGSSTTYLRKNDHIVAHITAYGRMMLHELEMKLGRRMLYCDTDSAYHEFMEQTPYVSGFRTGDLELELPRAEAWRALGRKSYSYRKTDGSIVCRQKGVTLKGAQKNLFDELGMTRLIESSKRLWSSYQGKVLHAKALKAAYDEFQATVSVKQRLFVTEVKEDHVPVKKTRSIDKCIKMHVFASKRKILWPEEVSQCTSIDSVPFGYISSIE